jgi:hypothetical protein
MSEITGLKKYDFVSAIIDFESGELDTLDTLRLFSFLIRNNLVNSLQGSYGRTAQILIDRELIMSNGCVNPNWEDLI